MHQIMFKILPHVWNVIKLLVFRQMVFNCDSIVLELRKGLMIALQWDHERLQIT